MKIEITRRSDKLNLKELLRIFQHYSNALKKTRKEIDHIKPSVTPSTKLYQSVNNLFIEHYEETINQINYQSEIRQKNAAKIAPYTTLTNLPSLILGEDCIDQSSMSIALYGLLHSGLLSEEEINAINTFISQLPIKCFEYSIDYDENASGPRVRIPYIWDYPNELYVGASHTIFGINFGDDMGVVRIELENNMVIEPTIERWSDESITFEISPDLEGIPFSCPGELYLEVSVDDDSMENLTSGRREVIVEPKSKIYFYESRHYKDSCFFFCSGISTDVDFNSPILPLSYRLITIDNLEIDNGVHVSYTNTPWGTNDAANIYIKSGPDVTYDNRLKVTLHIGDERVYDLDVYVTFFIKVPNGFDAQSWNTYA